MPNTIGSLANLQTLDISHNALLGLPNSLSLPALSGLYLNDNNLQSLPNTIGNLSNIRTLYIYNNHYLTTLPDTIGNLNNMRILDARSD